MQSLSISKPTIPELFACCSPLPPCRRRALAFCPPLLCRLSPLPQSLAPFRRRQRRPLPPARSRPYAELSTAEEEWLKKLPDKKKPLYSHSLPCIEAWLKSLGFFPEQGGQGCLVRREARLARPALAGHY